MFVVIEYETPRPITWEESVARKSYQYHCKNHHLRHYQKRVDCWFTVFIGRYRCRSSTIVDAFCSLCRFETLSGSGLGQSHFVSGLPSRNCMGRSSYWQKLPTRAIGSDQTPLKLWPVVAYSVSTQLSRLHYPWNSVLESFLTMRLTFQSTSTANPHHTTNQTDGRWIERYHGSQITRCIFSIVAPWFVLDLPLLIPEGRWRP